MSRPNVTTRIVAPCKNCEEKYIACHDHCKKFKEYKAMREKENEERRKYNFESAIFSRIT